MNQKYLDTLASSPNLQKFLELVTLAAGSGQDAGNVFELSRRFLGTPQMNLCVKAVMSDPASAAMVAERYIGPPFVLDSMLTMPKDSLGWTYAKVLSTMGYDPQFYPPAEAQMSDERYISFRIGKTHDLHHILTGFSLNNYGELGVISVTVAQTRYPSFLFLDLMSLVMSFLTSDKLYTEAETPEEAVKTLKYRVDLMSQGMTIGRTAAPLFPVKWEEGLERPLTEWREELNIEPVTSGSYSWYSDPVIQAALKA